MSKSFLLRWRGFLTGVLMAAPWLPVLATDFDCVIEPRQVLEIRSPLEGLIERVHVDRGDYVKKRQIVAVLDTSLERAAAAVAKQRSEWEGPTQAGQSRADFSGKKLERFTDLHKKNFISAQERDQAAAELKLSEADLRSALENRRSSELEYLRQMEIIRQKTIVSPVNGVVVERILNAGELAEAGVGRKPILKLAEIDMLYVEVVLPVESYDSIKPGTVVEVMPNIANGTVQRATVKVIDKVLDAASGTFGVRLELPNPRHTLAAGVRCKASFPWITKSVPAKARVPLRDGTPSAGTTRDSSAK